MSTLGINLQKSRETEISKSTDIGATTRTINTFAKRRTRFPKTEPTKGEMAERATFSRTSQSIGRDKDKGKNTYIAPAVESDEEKEEEEKTRHAKKIKPTKTNPQEDSLSHARTSLSETSYSDPDPDPDPPSSSTDDSEEEIRKTIEKIRRSEDARFSRRYRPAPLFDASNFASTTVPTPTPTPTPSLPNPNPKTQPKPLQKAPPPQPLFKPWTWRWKPPHPITRIPIPPPMHPEASLVDPAISLHYACGHVLPTYILPPDTSYPACPVTPTTPTARTTRTTTTAAPPHTLPPFETESIRSIARREKLSTITAGQECMCPNCFFWWHWVMGIVGLCVLFGMGIWMCWGVREWGRVLGEREGRWRLVVDFGEGEGEGE